MSPEHPHVPTANTCQNCDKHLRVVHSATPRCDRCLPDDTPAMKTCECHLARYCVKRAVPERRLESTPGTESLAGSQAKTARLHVYLGRKHGTLASLTGANIRGTNSISQPYGLLGRELTPIEQKSWSPATHIFVIYVDVDEEISTDKVFFQRRVRTAKCASEAEVEQDFGGRYSSEWKVPQAAPLCARIWLVDDGLPSGLESVDQVVEMIGIGKIRSQVFPGMECDWLALLEDSVVAGTQIPPYEYIHRPGSTRAMDELRYVHTEQWKASYGEQLAMAAHSALDVSQHPTRIVTNCLVLHVDVEEARQGMFGKITIRDAKMTSLADLRPLFHCDVYGQGSPTMRKTLFPQPNILRVLFIDDSLPYPHNIQALAMDMSKVPNHRTLYTHRSDWLPRLKRIVEK
ncbi:hypothetical protein B0H13DRAFT_2349563 [Mycena leptocephala]|nr:hypothetical protein B0H13DRAFT_2349563 [Mycena leptocephala]